MNTKLQVGALDNLESATSYQAKRGWLPSPTPCEDLVILLPRGHVYRPWELLSVGIWEANE